MTDITTITIDRNTKKELASFGKKGDTYNDIVVELIKLKQNHLQ